MGAASTPSAAASLARSVTESPPAPYLSVVVTTRNDDHGGDPLRRLHAFLRTFAAQCLRTGLDAEVIVVEWNPPAGRPRVHELIDVPAGAPFPVRVIEVPAAIHGTFRHAEVLPLFQMIAKNAGIRRARGRFVLATNIDIIFSTELVEHLAAGQLEPRHLYRVDRRDIEAAFPVDAPLEEQMAYCQTHQLRVHNPSGSHHVDPQGRLMPLDPDIVGSAAITLGSGWHVREGDPVTGFWRWLTREARVSIDRAAAPDLANGVVIDIEVEPNPYQPGSWVELEIVDGERRLFRNRVKERARLQFGLDDNDLRHELVIRTHESSDGRDWLPVFERRADLCCRVYQIGVRPAPLHDYEMQLWQRAVNANPALQVRHTPAGIDVTSDREPYSYCARYVPFEAPADGTYEFLLQYLPVEGRCSFTVMDDERDRWLPCTVVEAEAEAEGEGVRLYRLSVELLRGTRFSLFISNHRPGGGQSHVILQRLLGSVPFDELARGDHRVAPGPPAVRRTRPGAAWVLSGGVGGAALPWSEPQPAYGLPDTRRDRSDAAPELEAQIRSLRPLADLAPLARLLREHRPAPYQNAAGDFQLMAREDWFALSGYPELEMFSMNIDGLFEAIAHAAGIREHVWSAPLGIYHLEHEKGSGWTPEGESLLQARIAESGITWLDAGAVQILSTYMLWLRRPMIFNGSGWGLADAVLAERTLCGPAVAGGPAPPR